jgi:peroxiredoxin Q/BCP
MRTGVTGLASVMMVMTMAVPAVAAEGGGPALDRPAPDFSAKATDGRTVSLADFKGKVVVLYFYPKDDTPGCTVQAKSFRDAAGELARLGAVVLGVSLDDLDSHRRFTDKYDINFPLLEDSDGKVHDLYDAWKHNVFGRTAVGVDRSTFVIDRDGVLRKVWRGVKPNGHVDEVLAFVRTLPPRSPTGTPAGK